MTARAYKESGVDISAGEALVRAIAPAVTKTHRPGVVGSIGGFGGLFDPKAAGFNDPILVAATDGVGTKLKLALAVGKFDGIGIDLVAMCVNDLVCQGATPLFFLDYFATAKLEVEMAKSVIEGIAAGCEASGCALIGGETAEMPGLYAPGDFDLAGFAVGAAERGSLLPKETIAPRDVIIALPSSGLHSNGFSLVRKIVGEGGFDLHEPAPFDKEQTLGQALLEPTKLYVTAALAVHNAGLAKAFAHITGGGLTENLPRVLPDGQGAHLDAHSWPCPPVFTWLARTAGLTPDDMIETFNCGVGMTIVVDGNDADAAQNLLSQNGMAASVIGSVTQDPDGRVQVAHIDKLIG